VSQQSPDRRRAIAFGAVVALCVVVAAVAILAGVSGTDDGESAGSATAAQLLPKARTSGTTTVLFRSRAHPGLVGLAPLAAGEGTPAAPGAPVLSGLRCERVHYAAGRGLCVARGSGFAAGYRAKVFGPDLKVRADLPVEGIPSRARVSPDGRYGATTLFVTGHAYAEAGTFSTATTIFDLVHGTKVADLEKFTTYDADGRVVTATDVNYWGVTFAPGDSDTFYATLATGGKTHLIRGSVSRRRAEVLHDNVECPSLSPDGTRIAYKRSLNSHGSWRLYVLDLKTLKETPLAETASVDDQVEWLDNSHVSYWLHSDTWSIPADGSGTPTKLLTDASSAVLVHA
jgi:WD40-like Beta Propeller Repeat